jgi:Fic family protein
MSYNWQQSDWPCFRYDPSAAQSSLVAFADKAGEVSGLLRGIPERVQLDTLIEVMVSEAVKTSEIEGDVLNRADVMSSIRNHLGVNTPPEPVFDAASRGAGELMVLVRNTWADPLELKTLLFWHRTLFQGSHGITVGVWRTHDEPMQVVSGSVSNPTVHFEAPPSSCVPAEMAGFIHWFQTEALKVVHAPVRAALAHLYFESIHPFEDGNGRIGRAVAEKALAMALGRPALLSLSQAIEAQKKAYYDAIKAAQRSNEVTEWVCYFAHMVLDAQLSALAQVDFVVRKARFFDSFGSRFSERQKKVLNRMLAEGPKGFEGGMNARKYQAITGVSKATATRDLQELAGYGAISPAGSGRNTKYDVNLQAGDPKVVARRF